MRGAIRSAPRVMPGRTGGPTGRRRLAPTCLPRRRDGARGATSGRTRTTTSSASCAIGTSSRTASWVLAPSRAIRERSSTLRSGVASSGRRSRTVHFRTRTVSSTDGPASRGPSQRVGPTSPQAGPAGCWGTRGGLSPATRHSWRGSRASNTRFPPTSWTCPSPKWQAGTANGRFPTSPSRTFPWRRMGRSGARMSRARWAARSSVPRRKRWPVRSTMRRRT